MSRITTHTVHVQFGDCDPAGIVFFPNYSRWMDAASLMFFSQCGLPSWRQLEKERGIVGTPLLEINTKFFKPVTYGETIVIHTEVVEWKRTVFVQAHRVMRGDDLICEGRETRAFVRRDTENPERLRAMPVPEDIQAMCR